MELNESLSMLSHYFIVFSVIWKQYSILTLVLFTLMNIFIRFSLENSLVLKRKSKNNWGVFVFLQIMIVLAFFLSVPSYSACVNIVFIFSFIAIVFKRNSYYKHIENAIYSNGIVYERGAEGPSALETLWLGKKEAYEKLNTSTYAPIKHSISFKQLVWIQGVPVYSHVFKWEIDATANKEQFYRLHSQLASFFREYNIMGGRNGKYWEVTMYPKNSKNKILYLNKKMSADLPWYIIPLGASDISNKQTVANTTYLWKVHSLDDEYENIAENLEKYFINNPYFNAVPASNHGIFIGGTGGGKSVALKTVIQHLIRSQIVELYLSDPKGGSEFGVYKNFNQVKALGINLYESYEIFKRFLIEMNKRYKTMGKLGESKLPLDGVVSIDGYVMVDGYIFFEDEDVRVKIHDIYNNKHYEKEIKAYEIQPNMEVYIEGSKEFDLPPYWAEINSENIQKDGIWEFNPMFFICDEYKQLLSSYNPQKREEIIMIEEIQNAVETITRLGRAANIHIVLATQSCSNDIFPSSLKTNIQFRTICGNVSSELSRFVIGTEEGDSIPSEPAGTYLSYSRGETQMYQGFFTTKEDIFHAAGKKVNDKKKNKKSSEDEEKSDTKEGFYAKLNSLLELKFLKKDKKKENETNGIFDSEISLEEKYDLTEEIEDDSLYDKYKDHMSGQRSDLENFEGYNYDLPVRKKFDFDDEIEDNTRHVKVTLKKHEKVKINNKTSMFDRKESKSTLKITNKKNIKINK